MMIEPTRTLTDPYYFIEGEVVYNISYYKDFDDCGKRKVIYNEDGTINEAANAQRFPCFIVNYTEVENSNNSYNVYYWLQSMIQDGDRYTNGKFELNSKHGTSYIDLYVDNCINEALSRGYDYDTMLLYLPFYLFESNKGKEFTVTINGERKKVRFNYVTGFDTLSKQAVIDKASNYLKEKIKQYGDNLLEPYYRMCEVKIIPRYVDLGLPSGTLWSTMNVGASSETDYGLYFAWGETTGYPDVSSGKSFSWADYEFSDGGGSASDMKKYNSTDGLTTLKAEDDAVTVNMCGDWRMPSKVQFEELLVNTTNEWVTNYNCSGVSGRLFTSKNNGKTLFFPAAGYCYNDFIYSIGESSQVWTCSVNRENLNSAWFVVGDSTEAEMYPSNRASGRPIRGVKGHDYVEIGGIKWATMNVGASSETDYGLYFSWGGTTGYANASSGKSFYWADYELGNGGDSASDMTKYNSTDDLTTLEAEDDAVNVNWGGNWYMPTKEQYKQLLDATTQKWTSKNNVNGVLFTDNTDTSKTLFFPAAGYCENGSEQIIGDVCYVWSKTLNESNKIIGVSLSSEEYEDVGTGIDLSRERNMGCPVRGVLLC